MIRLIESFGMTQEHQKAAHKIENDNLKNSLTESLTGSRLFEDAAGVTLWEMPISRYNFTNLNGRMYSKALWERVINEQSGTWKGQVGLADHPVGNGDGAFKESACVWLDMRLDESGLVWGTCAFVGPFGKLAEDILVKGGRVGFSSSGLGDLLESGEVDPNTYLIERAADLVLTPSANVYGDSSMMVGSPMKDSVKPNASRQQTESVESNNLQHKGKTMEKSTISKLEEKSFRKQIQSFMEDSNKIQNPQLRLAEMEEILSFFADGIALDLKESVEKKIEEQKAIITKMLEDAHDVSESFGVNNTTKLKEGVSLLAAEVKVAMEEAKDWEKIASSLSETVKNLKAKMATLPSANFAASLSDRVRSLESALKTRDRQISEMKKRSHNNIGQAKTQITEAIKTGKTLEIELKEARQEVLALRKKNKVLSSMVKNRTEALRQVSTEIDSKIQEGVKAKKPQLVPTAATRLGDVLKINEKSGVQSFYNDLIVRHGSDITQYRDRILACRTVREAQGIYLKVLPTLNEGNDFYESLSVPSGSGVGIQERQSLQESVGYKQSQETVMDRMAKKGWKF